MQSDNKNKTILLSEFPAPEVLSIEPDIRFYDIKNGLLNSFSSEDLTLINKEAKAHVLAKIPESNLMQTANQEALNAIALLESLVGTIGWSIDYSALELPSGEIPKRLE